VIWLKASHSATVGSGGLEGKAIKKVRPLDGKDNWCEFGSLAAVLIAARPLSRQ